MKNFTCEFCGNAYEHNRSLSKHIRSQHQSSALRCERCNITFENRKDYSKHTHLIEHANENIHCDACKHDVSKKMWIYHIRTNAHKENCLKSLENKKNIKCFDSCFRNRINTYRFENEDKETLSPEVFCNNILNDVLDNIKENLQKHDSIKFNFELYCKYILMKDDKECEIKMMSHQTKMNIILSSHTEEDITEFCLNKFEQIKKKMSEFQERDSGWSLIEISHLDVNINKYTCIRGSQYIRLPPNIQKKKACINVKNNDVYCFKWALISALYPTVHSERCSSYKITNIEDDIILLENNILLNFTNLNFPLRVNQIKHFEENNPQISVNVFGLEKSDDSENYHIVGPYYFSKEEKPIHVNLLLLEEEDRFHYVWIKNISR